MPLDADIQKQGAGEIVQLFTVDLSEIVAGGEVFRFHPHDGPSIDFGGVTYTAFPVMATGFEASTRGAFARPTLRVSNIGGAMSAVLRAAGDIVGAKVTRIRTLSRYLDGAAEADSTQYFQPEIYYVFQKVKETKEVIELSLASAVDVEGLQLPRRQVAANACPWVYRGPDCGYTGAPITDADGDTFASLGTDRGAWSSSNSYSTNQYVYILVGFVRVYFVALASRSPGHTSPDLDPTNWARDTCFRKTLAACRLHHDILPFGGFPGTARLPRSQ